MSLLQQIIDEAIARDSDAVRLLRLCMVLAASLKHSPLSEWVKHELEGYHLGNAVPDYRKFHGVSKGNFIGRLQGQMQIPNQALPEHLQDFVRSTDYRASVSAIAYLVGESKGGGMAKIDWPMMWAVKYGSALTPGSHCTGAWIEIPMGPVASIIDQVKTKILAFALEIQSAYPDAGSLPARGVLPLKEEKVNQIFNTTINGGNVQGVAFGNQSVEQNIVNGIAAGDFAALIDALKKIGLNEYDANELAAAAKADIDAGEKGVGALAKAWLAKGREVVVDVVAGKGVEQVLGYAAAAVTAYAG